MSMPGGFGSYGSPRVNVEEAHMSQSEITSIDKVAALTDHGEEDDDDEEEEEENSPNLRFTKVRFHF